MMTLITAQLALGNAEDAQQYADQVDALLCCAREVPLVRKKPGHHLKIDDGFPISNPSLKLAYDFLDEQIARGAFILVYCGYGISRSAAVLCGYLAIKSGTELVTVLAAIQKLRPQVAPSPGTIRSIEQYISSVESG